MESAGFSEILWSEFRSRSRRWPSRSALHASNVRLSFAELFAAAEHAADELRRIGIQKGDVVGLILPNGVGFLVSILALWRLSTIPALISPKYSQNELQTILRGIAPKFVITSGGSEISSGQSKLADGVPKAVFSPAGQPLQVCPAGKKAHSDHQGRFSEGRIALIKFTSGTSKEPKGVALSAENLVAEAQNIAETLSLGPQDRILAPVPLCHSYGFDLGVLAMLYSGAQLVIHEGFIPRRAMTDLREDQITVFLGVPSMYRAFLEIAFSTPIELGQVRYLLSCTAPLNPEIILRFAQKFEAVICQHYGSSETGAATTHLVQEVRRRIESVGRQMQGVQLAIVDENGHPLPTGAEGEVMVTSRAVALGYLMGAPAGPNPIQDGTYRTGDIGCLDEDGFLYVRGRKDKLINVGGNKVSPEEVVRTLEACPKVREAAVLGVHDRSGEEVVCAVVTLREPSTENELLRFCRSRLAEYKVPRRIEIRTEMPRSPSGKITLREQDIIQ